MTREEALKLWLPIVVMGVRKMPEIKEALNMAIEALEAESRMSFVQEAVNAIMNTCNTDSITDKAMRNAAKFVQNAIDGSYPEFEKLEQEPCGDAISRQEVIELCEGWWLGHTKEDDFATEIRALPSVNPQKSSWIPVSERLPEESGMYLCSYDDDDVGTSYFDIRMNEFNMLHEQVAAWMYIPEPYKQEVEDE